jgi:hypothetical protein
VKRALAIFALIVISTLLATLAVPPLLVRIAAKLVLNACDWTLTALLKVDERLLRVGKDRLM